MSPEAAVRRVPIHRRPPTYWQCRRAIRWLRRFQILLIHRERWGNYLQDAPPIELVLPGVEEKDRYRLIEREINRLIPLVGSVLDIIDISTTVTMSDYEHDLATENLAMKKVDRTYDLIDHYFELPRESRQSQEFFRLLMQTLERGIGGLEEAQRAAVRRAFSPITWLAWGVQMPILILKRAGVEIQDASSKGAAAVGWALRLVMLAFVVFAAAKLGLSIPWEKLSALLR